MGISFTKITLSPEEMSELTKSNAECFDFVADSSESLRDVTIVLPEYSSIQGVTATQVKLGSLRRKP